MIRIITDTTITTMAVGIMVMAGDMGEGEGIGTTIRMGGMRIGATTVGRIVPVVVVVAGADDASRFAPKLKVRNATN